MKEINKVLIIVFSVAIIFSACRRDTKAEILNATADNGHVELPFACDLVNEAQMKEILGKAEFEFEILDGNRTAQNENSTSCFYKWFDNIYDDSGVLIQLQRNPLPDEIPDYVTAMFKVKMWDGENTYQGGNETHTYTVFEGLSVPALYNTDLKQYYFGLGTQVLGMVAFNYPIDQEKLDAAFIQIANTMINEL